MPEYFKIGKLVGVHGLKGELLLKHNLGKKSSLKGLKAIYIEERKDSFIPWFLQTATVKNDDEIYLKLEGIDSPEAAKALQRKDLWLPEAEFKKFSARSSPINLLGYSVIDKGTDLGNVRELIEQPHQMICRLEINGKDVLIPLHEASLKKIDHRKKQIIVELPDGLLEIYLGGTT